MKWYILESILRVKDNIKVEMSKSDYKYSSEMELIYIKLL